jgi:AcrR family transcriptional regulator
MRSSYSGEFDWQPVAVTLLLKPPIFDLDKRREIPIKLTDRSVSFIGIFEVRMSRKELILQAAARLFAVKGFRDTSMAEISQETGVASATIFYHYTSKEELLLSILANISETIISEFDRYFNKRQFSSGMDMIKGAVNFYLRLAGDREDMFLLLHRHYPYDLAEANPVCRKHLESIHIGLVNIFETAIYKGQGDGSMATIPATKAALLIYSLVDGVVRLNTFKLYQAGSLYDELITTIDRMLKRNGEIISDKEETKHSDEVADDFSTRR